MRTPVCLNCNLFYRPKMNGYIFCEMIPVGTGRVTFKPYRIWSGDLWECPRCQSQIIEGFGKDPISEHFEPDFDDEMRNVMGYVYA